MCWKLFHVEHGASAENLADLTKDTAGSAMHVMPAGTVSETVSAQRRGLKITPAVTLEFTFSVEKLSAVCVKFAGHLTHSLTTKTIQNR